LYVQKVLKDIEAFYELDRTTIDEYNNLMKKFAEYKTGVDLKIDEAYRDVKKDFEFYDYKLYKI
jgi:hypothetical protein